MYVWKNEPNVLSLVVVMLRDVKYKQKPQKCYYFLSVAKIIVREHRETHFIFTYLVPVNVKASKRDDL